MCSKGWANTYWFLHMFNNNRKSILIAGIFPKTNPLTALPNKNESVTDYIIIRGRPLQDDHLLVISLSHYGSWHTCIPMNTHTGTHILRNQITGIRGEGREHLLPSGTRPSPTLLFITEERGWCSGAAWDLFDSGTCSFHQCLRDPEPGPCPQVGVMMRKDTP